MKTQLFVRLLTVCALTLGSIPFLNNPAEAQNITYSCGKSRDGVPTTYAVNSTGRRIAVIRWQRDWGSISGEARCKEVSSRFQNASNNGTLSFLTHGVMSGQKVICTAKEYGGPCSSLLFTLRPEDNPRQVINDLFGVGYRARGPVVQSDDGEPQIYIDMELLLQNAANATEK
ncbi:Genome sequencing data, contig C327 (modular protein) [Planktothrix serta PCC 8927]|uniref:Genome sequencing data, contig C327 (Modular protein) n=1 Tax=Planktothrix serta PCC 8927 TaxID=671068 RepID=A0A7Z9C166_9CYAN|nr:COP23 domain-containing protein [Planktothrix serta]VXD23694.1 Genome sequencing data, contig C327 (modular protein) [Planktothrix serta PCC 8927]